MMRTSLLCGIVAALPAWGAARAAPISVRPLGSPGAWISSADYPVSALRIGAEGTTRFRLDVDPEGRVAGCTIIQPSGTAALDTATCALLRERAQFTPAVDRNGRAIASTYTSSVKWQVPDDRGAVAARAHFETCRLGSENAIIVETAFGCFS